MLVITLAHKNHRLVGLLVASVPWHLCIVLSEVTKDSP